MRRTSRRKTTLLRRSHYWIGLGLALPLVMLALTGILLNHTDDLALAQRHSSQNWLLQVYGVQPVAPETGFRMNGLWLSHARSHLWLNDQILGESANPPTGVALLDGLIVIAQPDHLRLFTLEGAQVERIDLPARITPLGSIASSEGKLLARGKGAMLITDSNFLQWSNFSGPWPGANQPQALPLTLQQQIAEQLAANTLTWEKIILDTHSGRIFGPWGPWVLDFVAAITIILAITGCLLWLRRKR